VGPAVLLMAAPSHSETAEARTSGADLLSDQGDVQETRSWPRRSTAAGSQLLDRVRRGVEIMRGDTNSRRDVGPGRPARRVMGHLQIGPALCRASSASSVR